MAFAVVVVLLLTVMATALGTSSRQQSAADRMSRAQQFVAVVKDAKFSAADLNGWQTAYAFDALRGEPGAAQDTGSSRKAFLASVQVFHTKVEVRRRSSAGSATTRPRSPPRWRSRPPRLPR